MKVDNAIILAAGTSSRFAPLSYERHKALTEVRGEVLIERQIRQLQAAGVPEIYIVTGYRHEQFEYLPAKFGIKLLHNPDFLTRNNNGSIWAAREALKNSYICSADNYFAENPFETEVDGAYYAAQYADGPTAEWCMTEDADGYIASVTVGGANAWYMLGHVFWSRDFSERFLEILAAEYDLPETRGKLWETVFLEHLDTLKMKIRRYRPGVIHEFDTLDELRLFDPSYISDTRSALLRKAAALLGTTEDRIVGIAAIKGDDAAAAGFSFELDGARYRCRYDKGIPEKV